MPVSTSAVLGAPIESVWALIGDFANLMRWHPLVVKCEADGVGEGATRKVHFADWWASERLDSRDADNFAVAYSVLDRSRPVTIGVRGTMRLTPEGPDRCRLDWTSGFEEDHPNAAGVNAMLAQYYPVRIGHLRAALGLDA
ncbi:MAG: SRPBCC family protein [Caulobacterales bacterium]